MPRQGAQGRRERGVSFNSITGQLCLAGNCTSISTILREHSGFILTPLAKPSSGTAPGSAWSRAAEPEGSAEPEQWQEWHRALGQHPGTVPGMALLLQAPQPCGSREEQQQPQALGRALSAPALCRAQLKGREQAVIR